MTTRPDEKVIPSVARGMAEQYRTIEELFYDLPKPKQPRPDAAFVRKRKAQLQKLWQDAHLHWDSVDAHVNDLNPLWSHLPDEKRVKRLAEARRSGMARYLVENVAAVFLATDPKVRREPVGRGTGHDDRSGDVEEFGRLWLKDMDRKGTSRITDALKKHLILYNYAVLEGVTLEPGAAERLPEMVEQGRAKRMFNPTQVSAPHPQTVLMDPRQAAPREAVKLIRITRVDLAQIAKDHGNAYPIGDDPYAEVEADEYWSEDWHCLYPAEGDEAIISERNPFQSVPFIQRFGPLGMESGTVKDARWLRWKCVGILEPCLSLLTQYDEAISALQHYMGMAPYAKLRVGNREPADAAQEAEGDLVSGGKDEWDYLVTPDLPQTIFRIIENIQRDIELVTFPRILAGFRPEGVTTASQNSQLNVAASLKFQPFLGVIEQMVSHLLQRAFRLIIQWGHEVTVDGWTLGPSDLEEDDNVRVEYPYRDAVLELEKRNEALQRYQAGLLDFDGFQGAIGNENAAKIRKGLIRDQLAKHPALIERDVRLIAEEDGVAEIIAEWDRQQFAQGQGQGGLVDPRGNPLGKQGSPQGKPGLLRQPIDQNTPKPPAPGMGVPAQMAGR